MKINFVNFEEQYFAYKKEIDTAIQKVINSSRFIMGPEVAEFERMLSDYSGTNAIGCANGTDALLLALMAIGIKPGDEVITTPFTFVATAEVISLLKAKPVFVDIAEHDFNIDVTKIESAVTQQTKAILPVSLYGLPSDMDPINAVAKKYDLVVIEDAAQSFGALYKGNRSCSLTEVATTSFFPAKPLGCYGDGGAVFTKNSELVEMIKSLRNHGQQERYHHKYIGINSRLDTIQAAILSVKLRYYEKEIALRTEVAKRYTTALKDYVVTPLEIQGRTSVWAQYTIRVKKRDQVKEKLQQKGVPTAVHYPIPLHLQEAFRNYGGRTGDCPVAEMMADEVLSLPMSAYLLSDEQEYICESVIDCNES